MIPFGDRLSDAVRRRGPLCVGIDPRWESLPLSFRQDVADLPDGLRQAAAFERFGQRILELVEPYAAVIKPQAAFFEQFGPAGMQAMQMILRRAKEMGYLTILDAKRGDIASTATAYAEAAFSPQVWGADSITVNPYLGADAVEPFVSEAKKTGNGLFVLVRTSNPGGGLFQNLTSDGQPLYRHVAGEVAQWNASSVGASGLGSIGAVVGATHPAELAELRAVLPAVWFLVPGYGAQGGTAADLRAAFRADGLGAIVNSSRGITFCYSPEDPDWEAKILQAAKTSQAELRA
ncbi:MAG: orotidine-5'-phosphate decarboxylase [Fimbriiglobus sp.]